ncbi:MAG: hypothetical protein HC923_08025 [Myxococcales bacterium]|nr:hypothetical protein [Myxococcales bacterium]
MAIAALAPFLAACGGPTPEGLCDHMMELAEKEKKPEGAKEPTEEEKKEGMKMCVEMMKKEQEKDPEGFKTKGQCAMKAGTFEDMMKCDKDDKKEEEKKE